MLLTNVQMASEGCKNQENRSEELYAWIATIPFSKPKKNLTRDFSDAVLMAEVLKVYYPRYVDLHNYVPANSLSTKKENWNTLNRKVLTKIDMKLTKDTINQLANAQPGVAEQLLLELKNKILRDSTQIENSSSANKDRTSLEEGKNEENNLASEYEANLNTITPVNDVPITECNDCEISKLVFVKQRFLFILKWLISWIFIWDYFPNFRRYLLIKNIIKDEQLQKFESEEANNEENVPRQICIKLKQQLREKDDLISTLNHKIMYLESAMKLKDLRISNLTSQILHNAVGTEQFAKLQTNNAVQSKFRPRIQNPIEIK